MAMHYTHQRRDLPQKPPTSDRSTSSLDRTLALALHSGPLPFSFALTGIIAGGPCPGATGSRHRRSRKAKILIISVILRRRRGQWSRVQGKCEGAVEALRRASV